MQKLAFELKSKILKFFAKIVRMPVFTAMCRIKYFCGHAFFVGIQIAVRVGSTLVTVFTAI